ncbi:hypothetical protein ASPCAL06994 [Aspergillus calidoustus]|uniref:Uncharacterized protein n=1 Tax=Aspergillus calidoustus TaxID=454130 RepID=A0A0U5C9R0_ASPCI|nr:hypothetical protein ASPCAL06994 [Aspergillus calidoustus]
MHIHKMSLLLAAIWLAMMSVVGADDAIPTSVEGGLDNTETVDTTASFGIKFTGWGLLHPTNTAVHVSHPTGTHGSTWNDPVDENGIPLPHFPFHPHAKKVEAEAETDVEVEVESVPSLCGDGWNDSEDGLYVPGIPFHPGHGHHPTPCPSDRARPSHTLTIRPRPSHTLTARGVTGGDGWNDSEDDNGLYVPGIPFHPGHGHHPTTTATVASRDAATSVSTSLSTDASLSTVTTHENIDLYGDGWNDSDDGLYVPGIPFQPGHGHHPTPCPSARSATTSTFLPTTFVTVASPTTHENIDLCGDGWNDSEDGLYVPGIPFHPGHGHHPTPCPSPVDKMGKRDEIEGTQETDKADESQDGEEIIAPFTPQVTCYHGDLVDDGPINKAIRELRNREGTPTAGVKQCVRVWCEKGLCVKWCNDDSKLRTLKSYKSIGDDVFAVMNNCHPLEGRISGMAKHHDKWRTIVHKDDC